MRFKQYALVFLLYKADTMYVEMVPKSMINHKFKTYKLYTDVFVGE